MTNTISNETEKPILEVIDLNKFKPKGVPWSKARKLDENDIAEKITPEQLYHLNLKIEDSRDRALFAILYLTATRIEELVRYQKIKWGKKEVIIIDDKFKPQKKFIQDWKNKKKMGEADLGIRKKDITEETIKDIPCVVFKVRNLKNRNPREKIKKIPVRLDNDINKKFLALIETYVYTLDEWEELFPFSIRNAERIINKIGWNPHYLRKVRLTHLTRYENYTDQKLKLFAGWTDSRPSVNYIRMNYEDLV